MPLVKYLMEKMLTILLLTFNLPLDFPSELKISSEAGVKEKYGYVLGQYNIIQDLLQNGKPVWQHNNSTSGTYLYYFGKIRKNLSSSK